MLHLYNWSNGSDLNRRTKDLQSLPLGHSGTVALLFGSGGEIRTPVAGFGDQSIAPIRHRNKLELSPRMPVALCVHRVHW